MVRQKCSGIRRSYLDISYPALRQRIHRGQDVDTAIKELLAKGGE